MEAPSQNTEQQEEFSALIQTMQETREEFRAHKIREIRTRRKARKRSGDKRKKLETKARRHAHKAKLAYKKLTNESIRLKKLFTTANIQIAPPQEQEQPAPQEPAETPKVVVEK